MNNPLSAYSQMFAIKDRLGLVLLAPEQPYLAAWWDWIAVLKAEHGENYRTALIRETKAMHPHPQHWFNFLRVMIDAGEYEAAILAFENLKLMAGLE